MYEKKTDVSEELASLKKDITALRGVFKQFVAEQEEKHTKSVQDVELLRKWLRALYKKNLELFEKSGGLLSLQSKKELEVLRKEARKELKGYERLTG